MGQGKPEGLAGDRMLDLQFVHVCGIVVGRTILFLIRLRERLLVDRKGHPAHDIGESGFRQHVGDTVRHPRFALTVRLNWPRRPKTRPSLRRRYPPR